MFPIEFHPHFSGKKVSLLFRDTYWIFGAVFAALFTFISIFTLFPGHSEAFWPFSVSADAAGNPSPIIHDSSLVLLEAAVNLDPNPTKNTGTIAISDGSALVADAGPSGTLADVSTAVSGSGQISLYVVRPGDTLSEIATMFGVSMNTIAWANNLGSARDIHPGQQLVILPISGVEHTVKKGDTLASLAKKYHADPNEIADYNGLDVSVALEVGSVLIIPGGELAPVSSGTLKKVVKNNPYRGGSGAEVDGYYGNPLPGAVLTQSIHGWNGVDLGAPRGTPIYAAADGFVIIARNNSAWNGGYGNYVVISHPNGTQTLYAHMSSVAVVAGQTVVEGQVLGRVGTTGQATGPHLHFEVRGAKNPFAFCPVGAVCQPR